ncbi:MAG: hypothetical protein GY715_18100 [Planctomycetes bacterium]|nr:hypothetical protein [Planctomycetota bacterium]
MRRRTGTFLGCVILSLGSSASNAADLSVNPSLDLRAPGLDFVLDGVGLADGGGLSGPSMGGSHAGSITVDVPGPVQRAILYWGGVDTHSGVQGSGETPGADHLLVDGALVPGVFAGSDDTPAGTAFAYRADVTSLLQSTITPPASLVMHVADPSPETPEDEILGASLLVVYTDAADTRGYRLLGLDGADHVGGPTASGNGAAVAPASFPNTPTGAHRNARLAIIAAGAAPGRPGHLRITENADLEDTLNGSDGPAWDSDVHDVVVTANLAATTVAPASDAIDAADEFHWILSALRVPCAGALGDRIWLDTNGDGIQDDGEPGLAGVTLILQRETTPGVFALLETRVTDADGMYVFDGLCAGTYRLVLDEDGLPEGFVGTVPNTGGDSEDSDFVESTSDIVLLDDATQDLTNDGGFVIPPATGACCLPTGGCIDGSPEACSAQGGDFQGNFTSCATVFCPIPPGACCMPDGTCVVVPPNQCESSGGTPHGGSCAQVQCPQPAGACCLVDGGCVEVTAVSCAGLGGGYQGNGSACALAQCPQPNGACCLADGSCIDTTAEGCFGQGGTWQPGGCSAADCIQPTGACCLLDGTCIENTEIECDGQGGDWQGASVTCPEANCPQPTGACCLADGSCVEVTEDECDTQGGLFQGVLATCAGTSCPQPPGACCRGNGACVAVTEAVCGAIGGVFQGSGTACAQVSCPQPAGACCLADGSCVEADATACGGQGGDFQGNFTTCAQTQCPLPTGACCLGDGSCVEIEASACAGQGGTYQGDHSTCAQTTCPQPPGACCLADGSCVSVDEENCDGQGGQFHGDFSTCAAVSCPQPDGACCLLDGSCVDASEEDCTSQNGSFQGDFSTCASVSCPQPDGACCLVDGSCVDVTEEACATQGGVFSGDFSTCASVSCPQPDGACCLVTGSCVDTNEEDCTTQNGSFQGDFSVCASVSCPQPDGACCLADGSCVDVTEEACATQGGVFSGDFSTCASVSCPQPDGACCLVTGACVDTTDEDCAALNGIFQGDFSICVSVSCPQPDGACCLADGSCVEVTEAGCSAQGGAFEGDFSACAATICPQPHGACCRFDGSCVETTEESCSAQSGAFHGDFSACASTNCPQPSGACCLADGSCIPVIEEDCAAQSGAYHGDFSNCAAIDCPQPAGDCCLPDGTCVVATEVDCATQGGSFPGTLTDCAAACPDPFGACCLSDGSCVQAQPVPCAGFGGLFVGPQVNCAIANCPQPSLPGPERSHSGWNWIDNAAVLTGNQPVYWSVNTGQPAAGGLSPFGALDPGTPPGRPDPEGGTDRVLRGYIIAWAVNAFDEEIRWNHLAGNATIVNYRNGSALEYASANYPIVANVANGDPTGMHPGVLRLDGLEYAQSFGQLLVNFQAVGASGLSGPSLVTADTDLTILPVGADLRQETDGPLTTKAKFDVWNMNEVKFSGAHRCVTCWDQRLFSDYEQPNHFLLQNLQTDHGKARIDGLESQYCDVDVDPNDGVFPPADPADPQPGESHHPDDVVSFDAPLLGVVARHLSFEGGSKHGAAAVSLAGMGHDDTGTFRYDMVGAPPESGGAADGPASPIRVSTTRKGSLVVFPNVELRWDSVGFLVQDTFLSLTNDFPEDVRVLMYFVNGDPPLAASSAATAPESETIDERFGALLEAARDEAAGDALGARLDDLLEAFGGPAP